MPNATRTGTRRTSTAFAMSIGVRAARSAIVFTAPDRSGAACRPGAVGSCRSSGASEPPASARRPVGASGASLIATELSSPNRSAPGQAAPGSRFDRACGKQKQHPRCRHRHDRDRIFASSAVVISAARRRPMNDARMRSPQELDRNLALDLVRVTEAAAMAAGRWVGRGDKEGGDKAAVDAMRQLINSLPMRGVVVIGEGEKDNAPMLYNGEEIGDGSGPEVDVAVDPIDGTTLMSKGMPNALAVLAVAERGAMFDPSAVFYMDKLVVGPECADVIDINASVEENLRRIAEVKKSGISDVTVCILDRPRHEELIRQVRRTGARIRFISDGDI